ncbi:MAG: DUF2147 domain-containing protein [Gammaproteobacteria bacterium]|nr:DUF2147 domain-containing protein [Gammaproteobacteria bacterium]
MRLSWHLRFAGALMLCAAPWAMATTEGVVGKWKTIDDETNKPRSIVNLYEQNGRLYGQIMEIFRRPEETDPDPLCDKCPGERANQPIKGMIIVTGLEKGETRWQNGKILDPNNGKEYTAEIWREGDTLQVRGYLLMFYRTQTWQKP